MANQSPDRRELLAMLARVAALSQFPGFSKWVFAASDTQPAPKSSYQPQFFNASEYHALDVLCESIIPADETPGAHAAGVPEFIDFLVTQDEDLQYPFRTGLAWLNAFAFEKLGINFADLPSADQEKLLAKLAYQNQQSPNERTGQEFFSLARKYTVIGYYTSRMGMQALDDPGLRFYSASPECPHQDDPEHKHLPEHNLRSVAK